MAASSSSKKEAMEERPAKLAKLHHLRRSAPIHVQKFLGTSFEVCQRRKVPELVSRKNMQEANQAHTSQQTKFWATVHRFWLGHFGWPNNSSAARQLVYISPIGVPATGPMQNADAWITRCIVRSSTIANVDGHLSQLLKAILNHWFNTNLLHLQGLQLEEPQSSTAATRYTRIVLHLAFFIMDGAAHKFALSMKGDSGSRFCSLRKNVFLAKGSQDEDGQVAAIPSYTKHADLQMSVEIWDSWARMATRSSTVPAAHFKKWEQACGITFSPHAILADKSLQEVAHHQNHFS